MDKIFRLAYFFLPIIGYTYLMLLVRIFYSGSLQYIFLLWNLFLALIPVVVVQFLDPMKKKFKASQILVLSCWILFFPNSLYIVTDLVHLQAREPVPFWFDIILVFSAAANGLIAAFMSLHIVEKFLLNRFTLFTTRCIILFCIFAGSFGVYLGRYLRWNSWDVISNPAGLFTEILDRFIYPHEHLRTWTMTPGIAIFFAVFYFTIRMPVRQRLT